MPFDGTLKFDTAIDQSGFKAGLNGLGGIASAGMKAIAGAVAAATGAVTALGTAAVKVGSGFESSMAQVMATMGITRDTVQDGVNSFELLQKTAQDAGANTTFSASEAADALNYLALAGYDAATAADALPAVLDLAAAGGLDLAYASDLATDAMASLGIEASKENLTAFGDQMAVTASKANTSVSQLGEAILTVGGTAKTLANGTSELNAALGVLANRGIKGAEGGTHLRNMILSLSAPTDTAKTALDALGVAALDASGNMRPLNETFADLDQAMAGMSDGDRSAVLSDIFNKTDLAAAQALMAGCGEEFANLTAALADADGAMAQMAHTMNDTLEGDMKSLQSKAEALGIAVYGSLDTPLRDLAQTGGQYLSDLTAAFDEGGFEGAAAAIGDILSDGVARISGYLPDVVGMGASILESLLTGLNDHLPEMLGSGEKILGTLVRSITTVLPLLMRAGVQILSMLGKSLLDNLPLLLTCGGEIIREFVSLLSDPATLTALLDAGVMILGMLANGIGDNLGALIAAAILIIQTIGTYLAEHAPELVTAALDLLTAIVDAVFDNTDELLLAAEAIIGALWDALSDPDNQKKLIDAGFRCLVAITDGLKKFGGEILGFAWDLFTEMADTLLTMDWAALGKNLLAGLLNGMIDADMGALNGVKNKLLGGVKEKFEIESPSKLMKREVGKYLALGIGEGFEENLPDVGRAALDTFEDFPALPEIEVGLSVIDPEEIPDFPDPEDIPDPVTITVQFDVDDLPLPGPDPDPVEIPVGFDLGDLPDGMDSLRVSIDPEALQILRELRGSASPDAVQALRDAMPDFAAQAAAPVPADAAAYVTNHYSTVNQSTTTVQETQGDAPQGDIIIPVQIGGQQLDTIVIRAAQIANARSGGVTI